MIGALEADIFVFSGAIDNTNADHLIHIIRSIPDRHKNAALILTTLGGDVDPGFRIMRFLQRKYDKITLFVFGYCKSAGTMMALGADEIVMSDFGEFGPLDVQVYKSDDLFIRSSGLDIQQALDVVGSQAYTMFEDYFSGLIESSQGVMSTKTAADIASSMAVQLLTPISGQIDPLRLGEMNRVMHVAQDYGARLCKKSSSQETMRTITKLSSEYHTHGFVIDYEEAKELFINVREPTENERLLEDNLLWIARVPQRKSIVEWLNPIIIGSNNEDDDGGKEEFDEGSPEGTVPGDNEQSEEDKESLNLSDRCLCQKQERSSLERAFF